MLYNRSDGHHAAQFAHTKEASLAGSFSARACAPQCLDAHDAPRPNKRSILQLDDPATSVRVQGEG
jgi:hypothetical protein